MYTPDFVHANKYPICVVPPEQHFESPKALFDDIKFYEQSRAYFYHDYPFLKPQNGKFEIVHNDGGKGYILLPTSLDYGALYRGQGEYFPKCLPTLYRQARTDQELFIERVRIAEFKLLLDQYEVTQRFERNRLQVDYIGLAQHYGLNTDVLDFTSDIEIAMFFAMCDFDRDTNEYVPKADDRDNIGYIFAVLTHESDYRDEKNIFGVFANNIRVIGMQPFKRPGLQKGYSYHTDKNGLTSGYLYSFSYTKEDSENIFKKFNKGRALWAKDEIATYSLMIRDSKVFSHQAISLAKRIFKYNQSINQLENLARSQKYKVVSYKKLPWANAGLKCSDNQWYNITKDFVSRKMMQDNVSYNCCGTRMIGQTLFFNYIFGCTDSPQGYNSGLSYLKVDEHTFCLQTEKNHSYLRPDSDGKIHAQWKINNYEEPHTRSFTVSQAFKPSLVKVEHE